MAPTRPTTTRRLPCAPARALARALLCAALLAAVPAGAATLGTLTAQSVRNEPLRAVVALPRAATGDTVPSVRLASPAAYERLGFVRDPALAAATVRVVTEPDGQRFVRIDSDTPVGGAELVLLLEADGGLRRLYRVNLGSAEPADRVNVRGIEPLGRGAVAPRTVEGVNVPVSAGANVRDAAPRDRRETAGAAATATAPGGRDDGAAPAGGTGTGGSAETLAAPIAPQARPDAITVAEGADLDTLARALRPPGATYEQSAAALWRANRASFVGRPPRPIAGALLQVPSEAIVLAIDPAEARAVVGAFAPEPVASAAAARPVEAPPTSRETPSTSRASPPTSRETPSTSRDTPPTPRESPPRDRLALAAPGPSPARPARSPRTPAEVAFDAEMAATLQRLTVLEKRLATVRTGIERTTDRELALMRELVRTVSPAPAPAATRAKR